MPRKICVEIVDDGSFKRFLRRGGPMVRKMIFGAITDTAHGTKRRVSSRAMVGPYAPHIKDDVDIRLSQESAKTLWAKVGYLDRKKAGGTDPDATQPMVALFQNYGTEHSPADRFMSHSAEDETNDYRRRVIRALQDAERRLAI
jgi:hypothetical protein